MRLGLMLSGARTAPDAVGIAVRAEQAGIADIWVSEDYFERGAFTMAAAVAAATTTARIGIGVINPWTRHPMLTAMEFAGLDELSAGRATLGIGASNRVWMQDRCGIPFTAPLQAVEEYVHVIRSALAGERVRMAGRHFQVDAALSFTPARASIPIYLGAKGGRALRLSGQIADGVLLSLLSAPTYLAWARQQCGTGIETAAYVLTSCAQDRSRARRAVRRPLAYYLGVHGDHDITRVAGLDPARAGEFRRGWLAGEPAQHLVDDSLVDSFAVAGDIEDCLAGLHRLQDAGLDCAVLRDPGGADVEGLFALAAAHSSLRAPWGQP